MTKISLALSGIFAAMMAALVLVQPASPSPIPAPQQNRSQSDQNENDDNSVITWSVSKVSETLYPGTAKTVTIQFTSKRNLSNVAVAVSSTENEFDGNDRNATGSIFSVIPSGFPSIFANQTYQIAVTLTAPTAFIKQSFGGTIHIRRAGNPPKTYASPLTLSLKTGWSAVTSTNGPVVFFLNIPPQWSAVAQPNVINLFPGNKSFDQNQEYAGDIIAFVDDNPNNLPLTDYYNGTDGEDLYSGSPTIIFLTLSGHPAAKYLGTTGIGGTQTVVVTLPGHFLRLENRGDGAQFDAIIQSLRIQ